MSLVETITTGAREGIVDSEATGLSVTTTVTIGDPLGASLLPAVSPATGGAVTKALGRDDSTPLGAAEPVAIGEPEGTATGASDSSVDGSTLGVQKENQ